MKPSTYELEFERRLEALAKDANTCAIVAYTDFTQHHFEADWDVLDRLNQHPGFWSTVRAALQTSIFISLSRLFDRDSKNDGIQQILKHADDHRGIFNRAHLESRKVRAGMSPPEARRYASEAYELRAGGLNKLRAAALEKQAVFDDKVAPIRHGVFAHAGRLSAGERDALFSGLPTRTLEDLCVFPLRMHRGLTHLYHDGAPPTLQDAPSLYATVLKELPGPRVNTWEHLHAAKDAKEFFEWFKGTPVLDPDY